MGLYDFTVYSVIERNGVIHRDRTALIYGDERITYKQLLDRVDRLSYGLSRIGVAHGDRIAVMAQNCPEFVYLYGACAKLGSVMLPINWRLKPEEVAVVISDGAPKVIFVSSDLHAMASPLLSQLDLVGKSYSTDQAQGEFKAFAELTDSDGDVPVSDVQSKDAYVIIHTAAVGGRPRGATLSQEGLLLAGLQMLASWGLTPDACNLVMLPFFHVAGLGFWLLAMQAGGTSVILPKFDADLALQHIERDRVTMFAGFPPMLSTLLDRNEELKCDLSSLKQVGGLETPETVTRFHEATGATFWTAYGQSETSGLVTLTPFFERPGSVGMPLMLTQLKVVGDQGEFLEAGQTGEIVARGPVIFRGYWNLEKDNEHTFRDGWHHTGDMGRFDEDGYLWYAGRIPEKELIKPGGENVYPAEVEKVILEHPHVEAVSVIGVPDEQWGEAIKAVCVLKTGQSLSESELAEFVASKIARFKKPKHVAFVSELPKAEDGSIKRDEVKRLHGKA